ncbi:hypothetical protein [Leptolyngbya sp. CCY15150]|uniref:hypothetical protein n=1 Tax=Leptolyngbya sp. CCY15150 TaxID=2767772 RepID=UPI00195160A1|nr:hypothetical protein [Leptolyngbya sp. CCY15150]
MNLDTASQTIQQGFRVTLGATAALVEALQHPQQYGETFSRIQRGDLNQLTEEWAVKGEQTEQEARRFVETVMNPSSGSSYGSSAPGSTGDRANEPTIPLDIQTDLVDLTQEIIQIRQELEQPDGDRPANT